MRSISYRESCDFVKTVDCLKTAEEIEAFMKLEMKKRFPATFEVNGT
jgi:hypothetical protein